MSYDLHLFRAKKGAKDLAAEWRRTNGAAPAKRALDPKKEARKRAVARAVLDEVPDLELFPPNGLEETKRKRPVDLVLTSARGGFQLVLSDDVAGVGLTSAHDAAEAASVAERRLALLRCVARAGDFHIWDPQAGRVLSLAAKADVALLGAVAGLPLPETRSQPRRPKGRADLSAYLRARGDAPAADRRKRIAALLEANGLPLARDDRALQEVNDWFVGGIQPDATGRGGPSDAWFLIAADLALWLGDEIVARSDGKLRWSVVGVTLEQPGKKAVRSVDVGRAIGACAIATGRGDRSGGRLFVGLLRDALAGAR